MEITFSCLASFRNRQAIEKDLKESILTFFKHCETAPKQLSVNMLEACRGGRHDTLIKNINVSCSVRVGPNSAPVMIHREGTQGVKCVISSADVSSEELKKLITFGPYLKKSSIPRLQPANATHMVEKSVTLCVENAGVAVDDSPKVIHPEKTPQELLPSQKGEVPRELFFGKEGVEEARTSKALLESGLPQHDLDLLRVFMLELVEPYLSPFTLEGKVMPEFIEIPCTVISKKMEEEWEIPHRRGGFGTLYSARISHFGYKSENLPKGEKYETWLLHVRTVINFAKGLHKIPRKPKGEGGGIPRDGGGSGLKYHLTEPVSPISDSLKLIDVLLGKQTSEEPSKELVEYTAFMEEIERKLASKQKLQAQLIDEQVLIDKDESDIRILEENIADLQNRKAKAQVVLIERRERMTRLKERIDEYTLPKPLLDQLKDTLEKVQTVAKLAGIAILENK